MLRSPFLTLPHSHVDDLLAPLPSINEQAGAAPLSQPGDSGADVTETSK
jgi:hypothetical protein